MIINFQQKKTISFHHFSHTGTEFLLFSVIQFLFCIKSNKKKSFKSNESDMHRVLSYQTAMQINDDRDIRTYITKRTCISLIFSASFFTLIIGKR